MDELKEKSSVPLYQFGFQNKIGCVDALSAVTNVLIEAELAQEGLVIATHDAQRGFESFVHGAMLLHTAKRGIHLSIISSLRNLYLRLKVCIKIINPLDLPVSDSFSLSHVPRNKLSRPSNPPNDVNIFVSV